MKVVFVERRDPETSSIERVFRVIGQVLCGWGLVVEHRKLAHGNSLGGMILNTFSRMGSDADVYHVTGQIHYYPLLLPRGKTALTIHDLNVLNNRRGLRRFAVRKLFFDLPVRRLKYITVVSEHVKRELIAETGCDEDKITVINNPVTVASGPHEKPFDGVCPTILHIGTAPHKNLRNLILAIAGITCRLNVIGRLDPAMLEFLRERSVIYEQRADISNTDLMKEYEHADIVSFCSLSEGFGLPIIEAQACSIPLVTSNISPMKEIAGDGAVLVDPNSPESIRNGILEIISVEATRSRIVSSGKENVKRFDGAKIAGQYRAIYDKIVEECGSVD